MTKTLSQHVGQRIRELREARGVSLRDLAKALSIEWEDLYYRENGSVFRSDDASCEPFEKLAKYFKVPPSYFFEGFEQ